MGDDELWRRRFQAFMLVRVAGLALFFLGVAIIYTDLVRQGGWRVLGAILAVMGAIDAVFAPKLLKRLWEQQDGERR
jgi:hypothetical protein